MIPLLLDLIAHMRWADSLFADALERDAPADTESARLFAHIASVEHLWYARIHQRPAEYAVGPELTVLRSRELAATHAELFERFISAADPGVLSRQIGYRNSAGRDF